MKRFHTRFAPSPTGLLHHGHIYSAAIAKEIAQKTQGKYFIRIEDIDATRCRPSFAQQSINDLNWLGLGSSEAVLTQSNRMDVYQKALHKLEALGVLYPCYCTRKQIAEARSKASHQYSHLDDTCYPGTCKKTLPQITKETRTATKSYALRVNAQRVSEITPELSYQELGVGKTTFKTASIGDFIIARKETPTSYHLSVVVDDAAQEINLVTRGVDIASSTFIHVTLQHLLGLETPTYYHHPLLKDTSGEKLAKKKLSQSIKELRDSSKSKESVMAQLPPLPSVP